MKVERTFESAERILSGRGQLLGGLKVLERIRDRDTAQQLPVILISPKEPEVRDGFRWSAFLKKPFTLQGLLAAIDSQLEARSASG